LKFQKYLCNYYFLQEGDKEGMGRGKRRGERERGTQRREDKKNYDNCIPQTQDTSAFKFSPISVNPDSFSSTYPAWVGPLSPHTGLSIVKPTSQPGQNKNVGAYPSL
jgi:hypothetical protein